MSKTKFRITCIDMLPMHGQVKTYFNDEDGNPLCIGDTIERFGQKFLVGYRYGVFALIPFYGGSYLSPAAGSKYKKLNEVTAVPEIWLVIGYTDDHFYKEFEGIKDIDIVSAN